MADSEELTAWRKFASDARSGGLYLNDEAAAHECLKACNQRIEDLQEMGELVQQIQTVSGFGDFDMARQLEDKFRTQAAGTPNSMAEVIKDNIEIVKNMREVMAISIARLTNQDYTNAQAVNSIIDQNPASKPS
ncbi:hypothetical protein NONO_c10980 [Nocardia nova SH22a]|uniref:Uncharacterized protein n=1 Tax=Nocardia nova SH22a TaxID=1415166 RepID=W5T9B5_9NOCA|nr:hypothetical protein [Nocardia nova]AHH15905.1 hypothetical protein NONO_c10980 [Nocardia nova SH22a]